MKGEVMIRWMQKVVVGAVLAAAAIGCGAAASQGAPLQLEQLTIPAGQLPDLPGCDGVARPHGTVSVRAVAGIEDLFLVSCDGVPLCVDSWAGAISAGLIGPGEETSSDPMPILPLAATSSDPMPIMPMGQNSSDPMPIHPLGSNSSDPMPISPIASHGAHSHHAAPASHTR